MDMDLIALRIIREGDMLVVMWNEGLVKGNHEPKKYSKNENG